MSTATAETAPLDDVMLAMDVVDTLRHNQNLVTRELSESDREKQLIDRLREIYRQQGIEVPDQILKEGVAALAESRFVYTPPKPGLGTSLARLYVSRKRWLPLVLTVLVIAGVGLGGYYFAFKPLQQGQIDAERRELQETLPARMDALYQSIFEETKVQQAANEADALRQRGKAFATEGNRASAELAITQLTALRDKLRLEYDLRIVNRGDVRSGFWRIPDNNTEAKNYYIAVEALGPNGQTLSLPILSEETGKTQTVAMWGLRVPESVYRQVESDKLDDGIIQGNMVGIKQFGYLEPVYTVPVSGGAVTEW